MASIKKRGNTYRVIVSNGRDSSGKQIIETTTFTPDPTKTEKQNQKALQIFALEFEQKVKSGKYLDGEKITFKDFIDTWKKDYAASHLEKTTIEAHEHLLNQHVIPVIGHLKLARIQPQHLNRLYNAMLQERKDGKEGGYSTATITRTHAVISGILSQAVRWNIILDNPCERVTPPKSAPVSEGIKFFTADQASRFLAALSADIKAEKVKEQYELLFQLAIFCGIRRGELAALEWSDLDFSQNTVRITKSVAMTKEGTFTKVPKSRESIRTVSVPDSVMETARKHRADQLRYRLQLGSYWKGDNFVFIQEDGRRVHPSTLYSVFRRILKRYNQTATDPLPYIPFHGLRHTSATLLISQHIDPRTVSGRLGHAQTSTTLNIYAHQLQEADRKAADVLEDLLKHG